MVSKAHAKLMDLKVETNEHLNQNRVTKHFKPNEYVFVLDRLQVPGSSRPLKTKFHPSPYVVIKSYPTTTLVKRISDGYQTSYSNNDLKVYDKTSPLFKDLPTEVSKVLLHDFQNLLTSDFCTIAKFDNFEILTAIELFDPVDHDKINQSMVDEGSVNLFDENPHNIIEKPDLDKEFETSQWHKINQAIESNKAVPTVPDSTELTAAGLITKNPEVTAENDLTTDISTEHTKPLVPKRVHDQVQNNISEKHNIDSASSDEDQETRSNTPVNQNDETGRSINLRSGTKLIPSSIKKVRFRLNPPKN
jgi:hypothetical protein